MTTSPIRPTDDDARALARDLIDRATFAALGVIDPDTGTPAVTRVAIGTDADGAPMTLVSDLSAHTRALRQTPKCGLLLGEPGPKGDPLTHPRLSVTAQARFVERTEAGHDQLRDRYLLHQPKARLYIDFADFRFVIFDVESAALNGGFGKAYALNADDLRPAKT